MKISDIPDGSRIILNVMLESSMFTAEASITRDKENDISIIKVDKSFDYLFGLLNTLNILDISMITDGDLYIVFRNVGFSIDPDHSKLELVVFDDVHGEYLDRRSYPRHKVNIPGTFRIGSSTIYEQCIITDVSVRGLGMETKVPLDLNKTLHITFYDKLTKQKINVSAHARHRDYKNHYGFYLEPNEQLREMCVCLQQRQFVKEYLG